MKFFRFFALLLAMAVFSGLLIQASAQQEVDPDHYDQAPVSQVSKAHVSRKAAYRGHQSSHMRVASKHSGRASHHRAHVSA
jgi:hypothetical protein